MNINELEMHNIEIKDFIAAIDHCKGDVFLETEEGDVLNLKSKLCQIAGLANILTGAVVAKATIRCSNKKCGVEQSTQHFFTYQIRLLR